MLLPVFAEAWQIESAVDYPPGVGDTVEWLLMFYDIAAVGRPGRRGQVTLSLTAESHGDEETHHVEHPTRLDAPGLSLFWDAPRATAGPMMLTGFVYADWHGYVPEDFPVTRAAIASLDIENQENVKNPSDTRGWIPTSKEPWYTPANKIKKWFRSGIPAASPGVVETGVLTLLDLLEPPQ
jgi:hypothetical protein